MLHPESITRSLLPRRQLPELTKDIYTVLPFGRTVLGKLVGVYVVEDRILQVLCQHIRGHRLELVGGGIPPRLRASANRLATFHTWRLSERFNSLPIAP